MSDQHDKEREIARQLSLIRNPLPTAHDLVRRLLAEGRDRDGLIILAVIGSLQREAVDLASMHRIALQRASDRNTQMQEAIDQLLTTLRDMTHLPQTTYNELTRTLGVFAQKTAKISASNTVKARRPRGSRFPEWMHKIAAIEARKGRKASPKRAAEAISERAAHDRFTGEMPDERSVGRWIKREQAKAKDERH